LNSYFKDPRLTIAFSFQSKYLGMSPFRCPSLFSILSFLEYEHGVFHPLGGCGQVSLAMGRVASELGVDIHLNEPVTELKFEGKRVTGVKTSRGDYELDALVINADFANTMKRLVPDRLRNRWTDRKLAAKQYSCSTFMLYLGIEGQYAKLPHHSIHIATDYEKNLREIELDHVLPEDPSFYVQNPSVTDPSLAPAGCSGLYILVPVPNLQRGTIDWDSKTTAAYRDKVLDRLQLIGIEGVRDRIKTEFQVTPKDWQEKYGVHYGATFNLAHSLSQMLHLRPHNRFEDLESVYLVGGGTHPGSGLPVIYESSRISCRQLLPKLGLSTQFMEVAP
jgi:phytoene desaturase